MRKLCLRLMEDKHVCLAAREAEVMRFAGRAHQGIRKMALSLSSVAASSALLSLASSNPAEESDVLEEEEDSICTEPSQLVSPV